jgi:hypothetical protein
MFQFIFNSFPWHKVWPFISHIIKTAEEVLRKWLLVQ